MGRWSSMCDDCIVDVDNDLPRKHCGDDSEKLLRVGVLAPHTSPKLQPLAAVGDGDVDDETTPLTAASAGELKFKRLSTDIAKPTRPVAYSINSDDGGNHSALSQKFRVRLTPFVPDFSANMTVRSASAVVTFICVFLMLLFKCALPARLPSCPTSPQT
jgi:hypothetical protein